MAEKTTNRQATRSSSRLRAPAEPVPKRTFAEKSRRALEKSVIDLEPPEKRRAYHLPAVPRYEKTEQCIALEGRPVLPVVPKLVSIIREPDTAQKARRAALMSSHRGDKGHKADVSPGEQVLPHALSQLVGSSDSRSWRRGESPMFRGTERDYSEQEFINTVNSLLNKTIKWNEYDKLYAEGRVKLSPSTLRMWIYGKKNTFYRTGCRGVGPQGRGPSLMYSPRIRSASCLALSLSWHGNASRRRLMK